MAVPTDWRTPVVKPRLLDLFACEGGAGKGYSLAGFEVVGVDDVDRPRYPFEFEQADALEFLRGDLTGFDAIHASPPCQAFSDMRHLSNNQHVDLLTPTRVLLEQIGLPYVLENVPGATLRRDYVLCGSMFGLGAHCADGKYRQLRRHRWFETNWPTGLQPPCAHQGQPVGVYGEGGGGQMTRGYKGNLAESREAMGTPWMSRAGVSQAIPPAYTQHIGADLMAYLSSRVAA